MDTKGQPLDANDVNEYTSLLWDDGLIAKAFRHSKTQQDHIDPGQSLYDYFREEAELMFTNFAVNVAKEKRDTLLRIARTWGAYVGSPIQKQSLKFFWLEECIEGENLFVAGTYKTILEEIARPALARVDIKLGSRVVGIETRQSTHAAANVPRKCTVRTQEETLQFDAVVVTVPLGFLKHNLEMFEPRLPSRLSLAIRSIGYGTLDKVYISFPEAFWNVPAGQSSTTTNALDPAGTTPNFKTTTTPLHQGPSATEHSHYAGFIHWLAPAHSSETDPESWNQEAMNLALLPGNTGHPTLLFYTHGSCSLFVAEIVSKTADAKDRDAQLIRFFEPYYSRLPNYSTANPDCKPAAILATAWAADELAGYGSYSNFQIGLEHGAEDIETIRHGMPDRCIWFAGEHTSPFEASGTTTGAYISGELAAERVLQAQVEGGISSNSE